MIPKECKRLAEVDFPIAVVSKHSAREKSIRHGHPSTLHLWWARRPLAACRAMLMALLLPDPCDPHCPAEFKSKARALFKQSMLAGKAIKTDSDLRSRLLAFIGDFADWNNAGNAVYLEIGRGLVKAAHPEETPLVVDPFAGGGSIPLEALRLGCDAFASDLNPVACLINKVLLEDIPRHGPELAEELRRVGAEVKKAAEKELAEFYPRDPDGARPIAYLWARTVRCEAPNCGAEIPLLRSFWLCKKKERRRALRCQVKREKEKGKSPRVAFEIFTPASEEEVRGGTVSRAKATCVCCNTVLAPDRVRAQLAAQRGGADVVFDERQKEEGKRKKSDDSVLPSSFSLLPSRRVGGATLLAVVTLREGETGRHYRLPTEQDYHPMQECAASLDAMKPLEGVDPSPREPISLNEIRRVSVPLYGATTWGDLFTQRQRLALAIIARLIATTPAADSIRRLEGLVLDRLVMLMSAHCRWKPTGESLIDMFGRHAIGMVWDFAEVSPYQANSSLWDHWIEEIARFILHDARFGNHLGQVSRADAAHLPLPDASVSAWFTDPPYYDSIPYAHLSDCFYVWLKRAFATGQMKQEFSLPLIDKDEECVVDRPHRLSKSCKDDIFFESKIAQSAKDGRRVLGKSGMGCVVFAHKTTDGWESLISGMVRSGWAITGSWPIATELTTRLNARDNASLASSVHLVCRPRPEDAGIGEWGHVLRELPQRVADWMNRLQDEGVRGADLVFACIGPALEVYSRYTKVVDAEEREIPLGGDPEAKEAHRRGFLAYVWEVVGRMALEQVLGTAEAKARNGAAGALEEDARLTALFLWTLQATDGAEGKSQKEEGKTEDEGEGAEPDEEEDEETATSKKSKKGLTLPFDVARRFAQPLGIHLDAWEGRCIETEKGIVRLIPVLDRAKQLFGDEGAEAVANRLEQHRAGPIQQSLFAELDEPPTVKGKRKKGKGKREVSDESLQKHRGATTLDHVHAAMLLQSSGRANALRALLKSEIERGPDFLRLANALSALYPKDSEEKRLLDAMLLAVPR